MTARKEINRRFAEGYAKSEATALELLQREVFGGEAWVRGYTTIEQAELLGQRLELGPGVRLLDVGSGQGWPSLYLARTSGCSVVLTDEPIEGLWASVLPPGAPDVEPPPSFVWASGTPLPFRSGSFDAVVHTDVL